MTIEVFYSRPGHLIRRLNQISVALFLEEVGHLGLTPRQYAALNMIHEAPGIDQARLSDLIAMDKTTIVKVLDRLVEKGWVTRTRSEEDRRINSLEATAAGHDLIRRVGPHLDRSDKRILAPLDRARQHRFMELLTRLVNVNNVYSRAPMNSEIAEAAQAAQSSKTSVRKPAVRARTRGT